MVVWKHWQGWWCIQCPLPSECMKGVVSQECIGSTWGRCGTVVHGGHWGFKCHCFTLLLPPTPSIWHQVTIELAAIQLLGDGGIFFVSWFWVLACCTSVVGACVKSMSPATVHVGEEPLVPVATRRSETVGSFGGAPVDWWLGQCWCRCLHCQCSSELGNLVAEG